MLKNDPALDQFREMDGWWLTRLSTVTSID